MTATSLSLTLSLSWDSSKTSKVATREGRKRGFFLNNQVDEDGEQATLEKHKYLEKESKKVKSVFQEMASEYGEDGTFSTGEHLRARESLGYNDDH